MRDDYRGDELAIGPDEMPTDEEAREAVERLGIDVKDRAEQIYQMVQGMRQRRAGMSPEGHPDHCSLCAKRSHRHA